MSLIDRIQHTFTATQLEGYTFKPRPDGIAYVRMEGMIDWNNDLSEPARVLRADDLHVVHGLDRHGRYLHVHTS
jgi:hypothetical protein